MPILSGDCRSHKFLAQPVVLLLRNRLCDVNMPMLRILTLGEDMSETSKKTTIYDLANLAGTSAGTVSAVINGNWRKRRISEKLAKKVMQLADENGFALNMQARALSRERSGIIGMIVPMYDNRYFSSIAQGFEARARDAGYFPIVTCTRRDPELEVSAARAMLGYQVEHIICTGATDPDKIHDICASAGVPTTNLDLPGSKSPSVISDNFGGARSLTNLLLERFQKKDQSLLFLGGRSSDHNTKERIRGFVAAAKDHALEVHTDRILPCGYAAEKAEQALVGFTDKNGTAPDIIFVNSTISLEGVFSALDRNLGTAQNYPVVGCFDWDPFAIRVNEKILMVRQDVDGMLDRLFELVSMTEGTQKVDPFLTEVPTMIDGLEPDSLHR